jgi:hypothetical protein
MLTAPTIQSLDAAGTMFVLRDESGRAIGTGSRETLEVLVYIAEQSRRSASISKTAIPQQHARQSADVRSALKF